MTAATDGALALILAPFCAACRRPLDHPMGGPVCEECWSAIDTLASPRWETPLVTVGRAVGFYEGPLREIIHAFKYDRRSTIALELSILMARAGADVLDGADAVVPVPLHRSRERSRGFNQARELARHLPLPILDVLVRTRRTESQADLPAPRRHQNVRRAFAMTAALKYRATRFLSRAHVARNFTCADAVLVLIDDVATTGATLNACADVLLAAGAREVRALTAARAVSQTR